MSDNITKEFVDNLLAEVPGLQTITLRVDIETQQAAVVDVIRLVSGKTAKRANETLKNLEIMSSGKIGTLRINGKGQKTWVADAPTLVEIIWELPGKAAKAFRRQSAHLVCRILGGDLTLASQIERTYQEASAEQKAFFNSNVDRPVLSDADNRRLALRKAELDLQKQEYEFQQQKRQDCQNFEITQQKMLTSTITMCKELGDLTDRDRIFLKDLAMVTAKRALNAPDDNPQPYKKQRREISIPLVCAELHVNPRGQESNIGKLAAKLWRKKYNKEKHESPPKRETLFRGKPYLENTYYQTDYDVLVEAINTICNAV